MVSLRGFVGGFGVVSHRFYYGFVAVSLFGFVHGFGTVSDPLAKPSFDQPCEAVVAGDVVRADQLAAIF